MPGAAHTRGCTSSFAPPPLPCPWRVVCRLRPADLDLIFRTLLPTGPIPRLTSPFVFPKHEISLDQPARPRSSVSDGNPSSSSSLTHQPARQRQASKARQQAAAAATRRNGRQQRNATQASRRQAASDDSERTTDGHARVGPYSWLVVVYGGSG